MKKSFITLTEVSEPGYLGNSGLLEIITLSATVAQRVTHLSRNSEDVGSNPGVQEDT